MPQRNGQNPIKSGGKSEPPGSKSYEAGKIPAKTAVAAGHCPKCGAEVPPKPGFRFSSLKCPKCGVSMGQK